MAIEKNKHEQQEKAAGETGKKPGRPEVRPITVHSYSGYKKDEKPRAFELDGRRFTILSVKKTWQEESEKSRRRKTFFRVHAHDGRTYDIALDGGTGAWTLESGTPLQGHG